MKIGLIARADDSGLGTQTAEFFRHMHPHRTLVIDLSELANKAEHCNKHLHLDRFPGAMVHRGPTPTPDVIEDFLDGLDLIFTAETWYTYDMVTRAHARGIKTVLQYNYEFLDQLANPSLPHPTLFAAPSLWNYHKVPFPNKRLLRVPIPTDRFTPNPNPPETAKVFLHPVGRPAIHDRAGTIDLLKCLKYITSEITMIIRCQRPGYVAKLIHDYRIRTPSNVTLILESSRVDNYWENYRDVDAVVLPRRYGGLCLPCNEALGSHIPVIMTDIDPNNDFLPPEWLVPSLRISTFDARASIDVYGVDALSDLAGKIDAFATGPRLYKIGRDAAALLADLFSWDSMKSEYEECFRGLLYPLLEL